LSARRACALLAAAALATGGGAGAAGPEQALSAIFGAIEQNRLDLALERVEALLAAHPNFRLAHLIRGDLLLARAQPLSTFGNAPKTVPQDRVEALRAEALARLRAMRERPPADRVPRHVLQLEPGQRYALAVDARRSRLYVLHNDGGRPRLAADYYVALGKNGIEKAREGDQKTPIGVYHVVASLPRSKLTDFYGAGAFPINYPNAWDRHLGRNGYGIWLHGSPSETYSRPPRSSDGCLVLANADLEALAGMLQAGVTPVLIAQELEWVPPETLEAERRELHEALARWRSDWESLDTERYLAHYSARFRSGTQDFAAWAKHKRRVNARKRWIQVGVARVSMFRYPGENFVLVSFEQDYRSSDLANVVMRKRQYWTREEGRWKIVYEGGA